jgi:predicted nuclease of predicted toxin-antitoxin system
VKLKLDANLGTRGHQLLIDAGHDVSTAAIQGLAYSTDATLIATCAAEGRALFTLDTDFANAMRYPPSAYAGIVVVRTQPRTTANDIQAAIRALLRAVGESPLAGRLIVVDSGGRVREYSRIEG